MRIEKINDDQIKFVLTENDLTERAINIEELTIPSDKTQQLFKDIMDKALEEYGFEADDSIMLQRTLTKDGKSVVKLNGRTVTQAIQREICRLLINIHGQHDNQALLSAPQHIEFLDAFGKEAITEAKATAEKNTLAVCLDTILKFQNPILTKCLKPI